MDKIEMIKSMIRDEEINIQSCKNLIEKENLANELGIKISEYSHIEAWTKDLIKSQGNLEKLTLKLNELTPKE